MGRFTKRIITGFTAALTLAAGGAFAGAYTVTDFDNGTNQHNLGYYYYYYGSGTPTQCNTPEGSLVISAGPADEFGPLSYIAQGPDGSACHTPPYCGAFRISPLPPHEPDDDYYPAFGFGISLTKGDNVGYGAKFANVDSVVFWAMTETEGVEVYFKMETIENDPNGPHGEGTETCSNGYPVDKSNKHTNSYMVSFNPKTSWTRHAIAIKPVTAPSSPGTVISTANAGGGKVGVLEQAKWYGTQISFKPENVTKIAWAINSDAPGNVALHGGEANVYIDDVQFVGASVDENFYVPPHKCQNCVSSTFGAPTPNKLLSDFDGADGLLNNRGFYWYSYDDQVGGGTSEVINLVENTHIPGNMIMDVADAGRESNGANILFNTGASYTNAAGSSVTAFVGIGANLFDDSLKIDGENYHFLNANPFTGGIYFEYWTSSDIAAVNVELTDDCDAIGNASDADGEVFFTEIPGTGETWKAATISFDKFVLPAWVGTNGKRRGPTGRCGETLNKGKLAQLKFKIEGANISEQTLKIDNVYFLGATDWGEPGAVKFVGRQAKAAGLRATYNRGVVGVNWAASQNIASGKVSLVNVKGRTIATAPLVKAGGKVTASLGKGTIPTGMYFVRINAKDVQGKKVVQQVPLSVVK